MGQNAAIAAVEQNTLRCRGIGLRASDLERASPGSALPPLTPELVGPQVARRPERSPAINPYGSPEWR
jgi:hypothetical protein